MRITSPTINDPVWWLDEFTKIFTRTLWYLSAHQRKSLESVDRRQEILDNNLGVVWRVASDEIMNGL